MSPDLQQFYDDYYAWLKCPVDGPVFRRSNGLCAILKRYVLNANMEMNYKLLAQELDKQFISAGLNGHFPFSSRSVYRRECTLGKCHRNKKRLAWVKAHTSEAVK